MVVAIILFGIEMLDEGGFALVWLDEIYELGKNLYVLRFNFNLSFLKEFGVDYIA